MRYPLDVCAAFACLILISCGGDDAGNGGGGAAGSDGGNAGSGGTADIDSGAGGTGGILGTDSGASGTGGDLCTATSNPFDEADIDCQTACDHFLGWCDSSSPCANPYCTAPNDCPIACETTKGSIPYVNAQWGCANAHDVCEDWIGCLNGYCK